FHNKIAYRCLTARPCIGIIIYAEQINIALLVSLLSRGRFTMLSMAPVPDDVPSSRSALRVSYAAEDPNAFDTENLLERRKPDLSLVTTRLPQKTHILI